VTGDRLTRVAGLGLCIAGAMLIGHAGLEYAKGAYRADLARQQWEAQQARNAVATARERAANSVAFASRSAAVGAPVARLSIPRIGLDEIVVEGVSDASLNAGPGHLPGSAFPGATGNAIISAHRDRHFRDLDELAIGDTIQTITSFIVKCPLPDARLARQASEALIEAYARLRPAQFNRARLAWHLAVQWLHKASRAYVWQRPGWRKAAAEALAEAERSCIP